MTKRALTLDNALNITPHTSINDAAGAEAAGPRTEGTTAPAKLGRRAPEAADHGPRSGGRGDQRPAGLWYMGADLFRPGRMAGP
jgi:hypothetical protein